MVNDHPYPDILGIRSQLIIIYGTGASIRRRQPPVLSINRFLYIPPEHRLKVIE
jgi:hypothetical protein